MSARDQGKGGGGIVISVLVGIALVVLWLFENGGAMFIRDTVVDSVEWNTTTTSPWGPEP